MSCMGIMMKGIIKGFNKRIAHLFVVREREIEIEIGGPTDVKHVGHIGWDGPSGSAGNGAPSWMGEFKTGPNFASSSIGRSPDNVVSPWTSTTESKSRKKTTAGKETTTEGSATPKKQRGRKKHKKSSSGGSSSTSTSSTRTGGGSSGSSRRRRSKTKLAEGHAKQT